MEKFCLVKRKEFFQTARTKSRLSIPWILLRVCPAIIVRPAPCSEIQCTPNMEALIAQICSYLSKCNSVVCFQNLLVWGVSFVDSCGPNPWSPLQKEFTGEVNTLQTHDYRLWHISTFPNLILKFLILLCNQIILKECKPIW